MASSCPDEGLPANEGGDHRAGLPFRSGGHPAHTESPCRTPRPGDLLRRAALRGPLPEPVHSRPALAARARRANTARGSWPTADCASLSWNANSSAASVPTSRAFRRRHCCGPERRRSGARGRGQRRGRCRSGAGVSRFHGVELLRRRPREVAGGEGHRSPPRHGPARRRRCGRSGRVAYTARHIVVATGSYSVVPPIPGLAELEGVWRTARSPV